MRDESWLIVDTETDGLYEPIHVVEIAAQRMRGWERVGEAFTVLLNHDVPIDPMAEAMHGYSREFLRQQGAKPRDAHALFREYAKDLPMVAYNISFDWNRALQPEYQRLGLPETGRRGFCAMTLARRAIRESANFKLETLKEVFRLNQERSHHGRNDVATLVNLFEQVLAPRLYQAGIIGFESVAEFSRRTPVASCQEHICGVGDPVWYILDVNQQPQGPFHASSIREFAKSGSAMVWREGMPDWVQSSELPEFAPVEKRKRRATNRASMQASPQQNTRAKEPRETQPMETPFSAGVRVPEEKRCGSVSVKIGIANPDEWRNWMNQLVGLCKGILADGAVNAAELQLLQDWLVSCPFTHLYPFSSLAEIIEDIVADGEVSTEELEFLKRVLTNVLETAEFTVSIKF